MNCPKCKTAMLRTGTDGDPLLANRGLLIKAGRLVLICPKCKSDVHPPQDVLKSLSAVLLFSRA